MSLFQIYELAISMVTALLGLAYPLFIDKINAIAKDYKSRRLSERFRGEFVYAVFNPLLGLCIVEMFVIPFVLSALQSTLWDTVLLTIQGVSVFVLSMCMVVLYNLLQTYNDPVRLFERIRVDQDDRQKLTDVTELMKYSASDEEQTQLFNRSVTEFYRLLMEFQQTEIKRNAKNKVDREPFYYPDYIVEALYKLGQASKSNTYLLLNKRIDIIHVLFNHFENYPITEQVYDYVWSLLNNMIDNGSDKWLMEYWSYACQYYTLTKQYSNEDSEEQKNRFREFHLMVGVLMVYMQRYDLLHHIFTFTSSLPAKYPLVPSTFQYIYRCYKELSKKNERMYLLKYHLKGMEDGAREDSRIEGLLLDYIAILLIRLNTVNDYNITYSDPLDPPLLGDTVEETERNNSIAEVLKKRIIKWGGEEQAMQDMGLNGNDVIQASDLVKGYQKDCLHHRDSLLNNRDISEIKRNELKTDMINSLSPLGSSLPELHGEEEVDFKTIDLFAEQSTKLDDRLILSGREPISNNLGEALVGALFTEMRYYYCYQFLLHSSSTSFAIPYRDMTKALDKLRIDQNFTILAMGVSSHFYDEVEGFSRDDKSRLVYTGGINVIDIASNENSFIIMKNCDIPRIGLRALTEEENQANLEEIESKYHLYSNINRIEEDNLLLKAMMGYRLYIKEPMKFVRFKIDYQLDSDNVVSNRVQSIKNYIA